MHSSPTYSINSYKIFYKVHFIPFFPFLSTISSSNRSVTIGRWYIINVIVCIYFLFTNYHYSSLSHVCSRSSSPIELKPLHKWIRVRLFLTSESPSILMVYLSTYPNSIYFPPFCLLNNYVVFVPNISLTDRLVS